MINMKKCNRKESFELWIKQYTTLWRPRPEGSSRSKHYCLGKKSDRLLAQIFLIDVNLKRISWPYFSLIRKGCPPSYKFRLGMEVFVRIKWLQDSPKARTQLIFFGICCKPDYWYASCLLYDLLSGTCCSPPIL